MKIRSLTVENVKSFRDRTTIRFEDDVNILVGPNAGGKSNLLDILTIILRGALLYSYRVNEGSDQYGPFRNLERYEVFNPLPQFLDKFVGDKRPSDITVEMEVAKEDINNIGLIKEIRLGLEGELSRYRSKPINNLDMVGAWEPGILSPAQVVTYSFNDGALQPPRAGSPDHLFLEYLRHFDLFLILGNELPPDRLRPPFLYFSPYRGANPQDLVASLANENYYELLRTYNFATSKMSTFLLKIATLYFARKRRRCESAAKDHGYVSKWENDPEVKQVTMYLNRLRYSWALELVDEVKNIYQFKLRQGEKIFGVDQASSGEKEIINLVLGTFAFNIRNGLILVDEPELHLHPKWQHVLRELFAELASDTKNQFVLATHSPVFITPSTIGNVRRVYKGQAGATNISIPATNPAVKDALHIVNSHNNERIFFADRVVLVEGIKDRIFFGKLLAECLNTLERTEVVEVVEVFGKMNFEKYRSFLTGLAVDCCVIADLDYVLTIGDESIKGLFETNFEKIDKAVIKHKRSEDGKTLASTLEWALSTGDFRELRALYDYIRARHMRLRANLSGEEEKLLDRFIEERVSEKCFILRWGEVEDYLPDGYKALDKLLEGIKINSFRRWLAERLPKERMAELDSILFGIIGATEDETQRIRGEKE